MNFEPLTFDLIDVSFSVVKVNGKYSKLLCVRYNAVLRYERTLRKRHKGVNFRLKKTSTNLSITSSLDTNFCVCQY